MQVSLGVSGHPRFPTALTIGNFDGLHLGHRAMLAELKAEAKKRNLPACVLTFEPHPREFFFPEQAPARLSGLREKLALLEATGIDHVFVMRFSRDFAALTPEQFMDRILVAGLDTRFVLVGDDFCFGKGRAGNFATLCEGGAPRGFEVRALHSVEVAGMRVSSSAVRDALASGHLELAETLLGRHYNVAGRVIHGDKIGRQLGFPTANIQFRRMRIPLEGVFCVTVEGLGDRPWPGAASVGLRPTIASGLKPVLEVHLLDFVGEIYRQHVSVNFLHKLRDQEKYDTLDALKAQIAQDVQDTRDYFKRLGNG